MVYGPYGSWWVDDPCSGLVAAEFVIVDGLGDESCWEVLNDVSDRRDPVTQEEVDLARTMCKDSPASSG